MDRAPILPIVDGDINADVYGYAVTAAEALAIARECFADEVSHVELTGPVQCADGTTLPRAWLALTVQWVQATVAQLTGKEVH